MTATDTERTTRQQYGFFGHPWGLSNLFATEFWERFSYFGMRAILAYYMYYQVSSGGLGLSRELATALVSVYGAMLYMTSPIGAWLADRVFGAQRAVAIGALVIMCGHIVLSLPGGGVGTLYAGLMLIILGTGLLKPNVSRLVGNLYGEKDTRRDGGFLIFWMSVHLGAFLAPLVVGGLRSAGGFHLGFAAAAVGMAIGVVWYTVSRRLLAGTGKAPANPITPEERGRIGRAILLGFLVLLAYFVITGLCGVLSVDLVIYTISAVGIVLPIVYFWVILRSKKVTELERSRVWALIPMFLASIFFAMINDQKPSIGAVYAASRIDRNVFGISVNPEFFQTVEPITVLILAPIFAWMWTRLGTRQISTPTKIGLGVIIGGISFLMLIIPAGQSGLVSPWWLIGSFAVSVVGQLLAQPVGNAVSTRLAPVAFSSQMVGLWLLSNAAADGINGVVTPLYSVATETPYFLIIGGAAVLAGIGLLLMRRWVRVRMRENE